MATIGDRIHLLRNEADLTQTEFGNIFGIVKSTVSLYESGKSTPNDQIKTAICKHFGVSMDFLLGLSDDRGTKKAISDDEDEQNGGEGSQIPGYEKLTDANKVAIDQLIDNLLKSQLDKKNDAE